MKKIRIETSVPYDVFIGGGAINAAGALLSETGACGKVMIVSDSAVFPLYGSALKASLTAAGYEVYSFVFNNGEENKTLATVTDILYALADNGFTRSDTVAALGGGVVGDTAGFAAGVYLRGIRCIQLPTTLLAAVDSSVGGKTGVDLPQGKNLAGVFRQPALVACDTDIIKKLPEDIFKCGVAEVIKYGVIRDGKLFGELEVGKFDSENVIARSVSVKSDIVKNDEFESGERRLLNYGHTFGHAVEKLSDFKISHGEGVAVGMVIAARFAEKYGVAKESVSERLIGVLKSAGLPVECKYGKEEMFAAMTLDKKREGGVINVVLPVRIGEAVVKKYGMEDFKELFFGLWI